MTNSAIADNFSLLSKLIDIHGDDSFKAKSYASAAFAIEKLPEELSSLPQEKIFSIKGIGKSTGQKIVEQLQTNSLPALEEYIAKTPEGVIEMLLKIKGLGPKKISTVWKEMGIESIGELLYACNENRLTLYKGFGEKTQASVKASVEFYLNTLGSYLYAQIESYATGFDAAIKKIFAAEQFALTGQFIQQLDIVEKLEWVTTTSKQNLTQFFTANGYAIEEETENYVVYKGNENILLGFFISNTQQFAATHFKTSCSKEFLQEWNAKTYWNEQADYISVQQIFETYQLPFLHPYQRSNTKFIELALQNKLPEPIQVKDIKGIIHSHSKWSDGSHSLEEMAVAANKKGYEFLVISDHSKTAFYAQGLFPEKVIAQHQQINELNAQLNPFKIFKSIESDILNDGSLDYEEDILKQFDVVIASIHSPLNISEEKAMQRLITAIENPYTSILGHMTGRLLLSRNGYPVNHQKVIDACAANNVVIELNAHPRRLDIDWKWIDKALEKNVLISINPDAHSIEGFDDCRYGVICAQKTTLTKQQNLSSFSLQQFEEFVKIQKAKR